MLGTLPGFKGNGFPSPSRARPQRPFPCRIWRSERPGFAAAARDLEGAGWAALEFGYALGKHGPLAPGVRTKT